MCNVPTTCTGVSLKTLELYALVFAFRLSSILFFDGYLPYDKYGTTVAGA